MRGVGYTYPMGAEHDPAASWNDDGPRYTDAQYTVLYDAANDLERLIGVLAKAGLPDLSDLLDDPLDKISAALVEAEQEVQ